MARLVDARERDAPGEGRLKLYVDRVRNVKVEGSEQLCAGHGVPDQHPRRPAGAGAGSEVSKHFLQAQLEACKTSSLHCDTLSPKPKRKSNTEH